MASVLENLEKVQASIARASDRAGRNASEITLICVSKYQQNARINEAMDAGLAIFAESRVQEAAEKVPLLRREGQKWHFIGPLQKNKINKAIPLFDVFQSVSDIKLAEALSERALNANRQLDIFLQENISEEPQKGGFSVDNAHETAFIVSKMPNLTLKGLMGMAADHEDREKTRPEFEKLRKIREGLNSSLPGLQLSMGMSQDFEQAILEGADLVRVGSALFA